MDNNNLKKGLVLLGILILIMDGYNYSNFNSVPQIFAQVIPRDLASNNSITINSEPNTTTTHTSYIIEGSSSGCLSSNYQ